MKPRLFITRRIPEDAIQKARETFEVAINPENRVMTKPELINAVKDCDVLLCLLTDLIDKDVIKTNPNLKGIANYAVGFNNIDVSCATKHRIPVSNTPGVLTETTADLAWSLLMAVARKIVISDSYTRGGNFTGWEPMLMLGNDIYGKTLGIIGAGRIGTAVARRAIGFNMNILYADFEKNYEIEEKCAGKKVSVETLLQTSDYISLHVPLLPETKHLISYKEFDLMKPSAILINTSRGAVIEEEALVDALTRKRICGAGLDVYEDEPQIHPQLLKLENVILLPHIGSATIETRTKMGLLAVKNAEQMIKNDCPQNIVNPEIFQR